MAQGHISLSGAMPTATTKKRKLGTIIEGLGVSDHFAVDLMGTCAAPGGRISSPELKESSARMLEITGGRWPRNVTIPRAAGEDMFTSRLAHEMKIFPYGRNIAVVVSAVMDKDRQHAMRKRRAFTRVGDPSREVKKACGIAKSAAPAAASHRWLRSLPSTALANLHQVRRSSRPARASHLLLSPRRSEGHCLRCALLRRWRVGPNSPWTSGWTTTVWVVS
jgi:hypothetical protein